MKKPTLDELTLREKIGQTAVGYCHNDFSQLDGAKPWGALYVSSGMRFKEFNARFDIRADKGANYQEWIELMENANTKLRIPILGVTDNGIGLSNMFSEMPKLTTNLSIGAADDEELAYQAGYARGLQMRCIGAKWWWGPEVDRMAWKSPINSARQFSWNPDDMIRMAKAMIKGCQDAGVAATAKHFPGEDQMEHRDGHIAEMVNYLTLEEWEAHQGRIYKELIADGVLSIMTAHTAFPAVDPSKIGGYYRPSSISYPVVTGLLKEKLGFEGVVVTDGLSMRSLVTALDESMERVYVEAFKAGNDMLLGCEDYYIDVIEKAVNDGEISMERVDDACRRVLDMKEKIGMFDEDYMVADDDLEGMRRYCLESNIKIADKSIHLVCDRKQLLPVSREEIQTVAMVYFCPREYVRKEYFAMQREFEKRGAKVTVYPVLTSREMMKQIADENDLIVYLAHYDENGSFVYPEYRAFYYALLNGSEKSVVVNTSDHTMYYEFFSRFPAFINAFTASDEIMTAVVGKIYGESAFRGLSPYPLCPPHITEYLKDKPYGWSCLD